MQNLFLSYKSINKLTGLQRPQQNIAKTVFNLCNGLGSLNAYQQVNKRPYYFHSFKPIYSFSAQKSQLKDTQSAKQQPKGEQAKNAQTTVVQQNVNQKDEDSKNKELELIFAKIKKQQQEQIFDPDKHLQEFEKKVRNTNINVIKRELFNDSMQLPIKYLAYTLAGQASVGTFLAELCRSSIDAVNHLMLYLTNYIDVKPNKQYPQGTENIKYLVVLIPSLLFFFFGGYTIYSSFIEYLAAAPAEATEGGDNLYSILLYLASFGIEISVIAYNIRDSIRMQNITNQDVNPSSQSFLSIVKSLISKKDPLLQAVLYENFITLLSMSVPLVVGVSNTFCQSNLPEFIGQNVIGLIQLFVGYRLGKETIQGLLGQSVDDEIMNDIHEEILKNPYVKSISNAKGIMSGSVRFKYTAIVEYDFESLNEDAMEDYRQMSDYIIYSQDYKDRQEELEELMESFPLRLLKEIKRQEELILASIQRKYPQCDYFDLNMDSQKLYAFLDEEERIKNSFHQELDSDDEQVETEDEKQIKEWILQESSRISQMRFTKNIKVLQKSQDQLYLDNLHYKQNPKHYSNSINPIFLQEKYLQCENERAAILFDELNFEDNYKNDEDPLQ